MFGTKVDQTVGVTETKYNSKLNEFGTNAGIIPLNLEHNDKLLQDLKELGYNVDQQVDCIAIISAFACISRIVDATGHKLPLLTQEQLQL